MTVKRSEIESAIATTIICIIILLILFFCGMTAKRNEADEGVMISLGYADEGFGEHTPDVIESNSEPTPIPSNKPVISKPQPIQQPDPKPEPEAAAPVEEKLVTQEDPSVAIEAEKRRKEQEAEDARIRLEKEKQRQEKLEQERIERERAEQERIEREKAEEEARIRAEKAAAADKANKLAGSAFQNKGKGQGTTKGDSQQGNPAGRGSQGGHSWSLNGRNLNGTLAQPPYHSNDEGKIVVEIRVDAAGKVVSANISQKGTTITNQSLRDEAIKAAKRNSFSGGEGIVYGTITYTFKLN